MSLVLKIDVPRVLGRLFCSHQSFLIGLGVNGSCSSSIESDTAFGIGKTTEAVGAISGTRKGFGIMVGDWSPTIHQ